MYFTYYTILTNWLDLTWILTNWSNKSEISYSRCYPLITTTKKRFHMQLVPLKPEQTDIWPHDGGSSGSSCQIHTSSEMLLSVFVLQLSRLMWNSFSLFECVLSGKKRPKLESSLPSFWGREPTANGCVASSQMRHPSVLGLPTVSRNRFIFSVASQDCFAPMALIICQIGLETLQCDQNITTLQMYLSLHKVRTLLCISWYKKFLLQSTKLHSAWYFIRFLITLTSDVLHLDCLLTGNVQAQASFSCQAWQDAAHTAKSIKSW